MVRLRRAVCERYYGLIKAEQIYERLMDGLENKRGKGAAGEEEKDTTTKVIEMIKNGLFRRSEENEESIPRTRSF